MSFRGPPVREMRIGFSLECSPRSNSYPIIPAIHVPMFPMLVYDPIEALKMPGMPELGDLLRIRREERHRQEGKNEMNPTGDFEDRAPGGRRGRARTIRERRAECCAMRRAHARKLHPPLMRAVNLKIHARAPDGGLVLHGRQELALHLF